jgi:hypothetical protein
VFRSYSAGAVTGNPAGGLAGNKNVLGDVIASYWDTITSGCTTSGGGTGKTTAQMRSAASYQNWDFDTIWSICESVGYPSFWWQVPTADFRCPDGVTTVDFARFATQWRRNDCGAVNSDCEWTDLDGSGDVGIPDLAILADQWLSGLY